MTTPPIGFNNLYNLSSAPAGLSMVWVATMGAAATMPGPLLATTMGVLEILCRRAENPITRVAMNIAAPADVGLSAP